MMKNFFRKQKELLAVLVYAGLVVALVYFLILPLVGRIEGVNDKIQEESLKQQIVNQQLEELPEFRQQYDALAEKVSLADVLLDKDNAVVLIERLEKMAGDTGNGIAISVAAPANVPAQKSAKSSAAKTNADAEVSLVGSLPSADYLQMKISLTGSYGAIYAFIRSLESFEYYSDIIGIQMKQEAAKNSSGGMFSPGGFRPATGAEEKDPAAARELSAALDVVFYTKKQ